MLVISQISRTIGNYAYVPFTTYDSVTEIPTDGIILTSDTWKDAEFPPYKFYEFEDTQSKAFGVGYCLYGQMSAEARKGITRAGWFDGSTKKIYPCVYYGSAKEIYGTGITSYSWRTPVIKDSNGILMTWYKIENDTFIELEFLNSYSGQIELPEHFAGKRMEVIKKSESVNVLGDIVGASGINIIASSIGSTTIRCY